MKNILAPLLVILALAFLVAAIFSAWLAVNWVLGPLDRAAKNRRYPIQFTLGDFLCLFVQIQLLLAWPAALFQTMEDKSAFVGVAIGVVALTLLVWWTGVHTLSRAGVHNTLGRALTLTIGIPFGYAGSLAIPVVAVMMLGSLIRPDREMGIMPRLPIGALLLFVEAAIILAVVGLGFMTRRILASVGQPRQPVSSNDTAPPV